MILRSTKSLMRLSLAEPGMVSCLVSSVCSQLCTWLLVSRLVFVPPLPGWCICPVSNCRVVLPPVAAVIPGSRLVRSRHWPNNVQIAGSPQLHIPQPWGILADILHLHNTPTGLLDVRGTRLDHC